MIWQQKHHPFCSPRMARAQHCVANVTARLSSGVRVLAACAGGAVFHPLSHCSWRLESATGCEVLLELCKSRLHTFPDLGSKVKNYQTSKKPKSWWLSMVICMVIKPETQLPNVAAFFALWQQRCWKAFPIPASLRMNHLDIGCYWATQFWPLPISIISKRTQHCCHRYSQVASESCEFGSRQSFSIAETLEQYHGSLAVQQW